MKKHTPHSDKDNLVEFSSKEFIDHETNELWYVGVGLLLVTTVYLSIKYQNYTLSAVIIAAGIAIFRLARVKPKHKEVKITSQGVFWGGDFFAYHKLRCFWVAASGSQTMVYLERLNLSPVISLDVPENKVEDIVTTLTKYLPHHSHKNEPFIDKFSRFFRI